MCSSDLHDEGCDECTHGYRGRIAVQEVLVINDEIRSALNQPNVSREDLRKMVYTSDVTTLLQDGLNKILEGITSFDEIYKAIEIEDDLEDNTTTVVPEEPININQVEIKKEVSDVI